MASAAALTLPAAMAFGDAATEKQARALQKKAIEHDNLNIDYGAAVKKLNAAIKKCGTKRCAPKLRAALVRDLGAMQVLGGDVSTGQATFDQAAQLDATMQLDSAYANATLQSMWAAAVTKATGGAAPPAASSAASAEPPPPPSPSSSTAAPDAGEAPTPEDKEEKKEETHEESQDDARQRENKEEDEGPPLPRVWVGVEGGFDLVLLRNANDVCELNPQGNVPLSSDYYCVDPTTNVNVPGGVGMLQPPADPQSWSASIRHGIDDGVAGGIAPSNLRLLVSLDYALTQNILVGIRAGYVLFTYTAGSSTAPASPYAPFPPFHIEARFTYVIGKNALTTPGFHPVLYVGAGVGELDAKVSVRTDLDKNACPNPGNPLCPANYNSNNLPIGGVDENAWLLGGPFFFRVGLGGRIAFSSRFAITVGGSFVGAVGGPAGFLPGVEPQVAAQVGF